MGAEFIKLLHDICGELDCALKHNNVKIKEMIDDSLNEIMISMKVSSN